jgi:hypothetical protein
MHYGDWDSAGTGQNRPASRSSEQDVGQPRKAEASSAPTPARGRTVREPQSKRTWASRRADGPSWADDVEPF